MIYRSPNTTNSNLQVCHFGITPKCACITTACSPFTTKKEINRSTTDIGNTSRLVQTTDMNSICSHVVKVQTSIAEIFNRIVRVHIGCSQLSLHNLGGACMFGSSSGMTTATARSFCSLTLSFQLWRAFFLILETNGLHRELSSRAIYLFDMCFPVCFLQPWDNQLSSDSALCQWQRAAQPVHSSAMNSFPCQSLTVVNQV